LQRDQAVGIERESRKPFDLTFSGSLLERSAFLNRTQESPAIETMFYSTLVDYDLRVLVLADWSQRFAPVRLTGSLLANVWKESGRPKTSENSASYFFAGLKGSLRRTECVVAE
jgi:hypothetical protein